jgi:predicted Zn finger-like uncharacterized protein
MKITCQACQAKYTIADEKVVGKVVKIRCKKCGASIVVNGNEPSTGASSSGPPAALSASPGDRGVQGSWTVNVGDGDQRTMTDAEIVAAYRSGVVGDDTFCWKEAMPDWLPLQEISGLAAACAAEAPAAAAPAPAETNLPSTMIDPSIAAVGAGAAPRLPPRASTRPATKDGNGSLAGPPPAATVAARRTGGRGTAADLFSGAARAGGEDEVMTSAPTGVPQPHDDGQKPTGARNENSVLFALNDKGAAPQPTTMPATNEASGLIDIRQLSAQMRSSTDDKKKSRVDDIMNLGGGSAFSPTLAAPVLSAPSLEHYSQPPPGMLGAMGGAGAADAKSKALIFLSLGAGTFFLVAAIGVAVLLFRGKGAISDDDREKPTASATVAGKSPASGGSVAAAPSGAAPGETAQASAAPEAPSAPAPESASASKELPTKETKETAAKETAATPPAPAAPKEPKAPAAAAPKEAPAPAGAPVAEFNMGEARSRLASVAGGVQTCKRGDTTGAGRVEIIFSPSGAVQSANLMPGSPFDGTPTGKCVEARFRGARVPPFGGSPFTVTKSFSIN